MDRKNYAPLREAHQNALDALNNHLGQKTQQPTQDVSASERAPTRPEGHTRQSPGWTAEGGMAQQQASANAWARAAESPERQAARAALDQHIERGAAGRAPEQTLEQKAEISRKSNDIER